MLQHCNLAEGRRVKVILILAMAAIPFSSITLEGQKTTAAGGAVAGVIKNASGQPVAGAMVKVKNPNLGLSFMVVSQAQGQYNTPELVPGKYTVQGFGGGYQSELAGPVEVGGGQEKMDLVLSAPLQASNSTKPKAAPDYAAMIPDGDAKKIIMTRCVICHGVERIAPARFSREDWQNIVERMSLFIGERADLQKKYHVGSLSDQEAGLLVDFLTTHFGPNTPPSREKRVTGPNDNMPATFLQGPQTKFVAMELDRQGRSQVYDIAPDSQGTAWVSGRQGANGVLSRFDKKSATFSTISLPPDKTSSLLGGLAVDLQGRVWISDRDPKNFRWLQYNPNTNEFTAYDIPALQKLPPSVWKLYGNVNTMAFTPDGSVWGAGNTSSRILKLDPITRKITEYPVLLGSHPHGMTIGGDKAIWYAAIVGQEVVRLDPQTGEMTHYQTNVPNAGSRMAADADGNLWIVSRATGQLIKVDYRTGKVTQYTPPSKDGGPFAVDADKKRNLIWFDESNAGNIARFDPRNDTFVEFPLLSAGTDVFSMKIDPTNSNRVWWSAPNKIGYFEARD